MTLFEWDNAKASANWRKHAITFETAQYVFDDPHALTEVDHIEGEIRWRTIGLVGGTAILFVAHTIEEGQVEKIRIIPLDTRLGRNGCVMKTIVRRTLGKYKLTEKQRRELEKLAAMPDETIDLSDIPEATEKFWKNAVRNPWYRPRKQQVTLRIDADVLAWLRRGGKGYQSRLNSLLRNAMLEQLRGKTEPHRGKKKSA